MDSFIKILSTEKWLIILLAYPTFMIGTWIRHWIKPFSKDSEWVKIFHILYFVGFVAYWIFYILYKLSVYLFTDWNFGLLVGYFKNLHPMQWLLWGPISLAVITWVVVFILWILKRTDKFPNPLVYLWGGLNGVAGIVIILVPISFLVVIGILLYNFIGKLV
tara:strand:- start:105 stop:590 length:486 start_codon:yes stop_codon:yes gene_type:complete